MSESLIHADKYFVGMLELYQRLKHMENDLQGDLAFVKDWDFFVPDPEKRLEDLVPEGPYAGTLEAFATGVKLRTRYAHLLQYALEQNQTSFWASGSHRVIETARYFATGFFGMDWDRNRLHVIPETSDLGGDTLTPGDTCKNYVENINPYGHDYGYRKLKRFQTTYLPTIAARLSSQNPGIKFTLAEIYIMQEICGFETLAKGNSPWCTIFTHDEWLSFEYARDLLHYYRSGPGNAYGAVMGMLYLNATTTLLQAGAQDSGSLFFSFVHDGDIIPLIAALNLYPELTHLSTSEIPLNRTFRTSTTVPMGGRIIFERLACLAPEHCWALTPMYPHMIFCDPPREDIFVRVNVNDGIVAIPGCEDGPGRSCELERFVERVEKRGREIGEFGCVCGLERSAKKGITFLHQ